jgi:hypothetical protein
VRELSVSKIGFEETLRLIEKEVLNLFRDEMIEKTFEESFCSEVFVRLPGGVFRMHLTDDKIVLANIPGPVLSQSTPVLLENDIEEPGLIRGHTNEPWYCRSRITAAIYDRTGSLHFESKEGNYLQKIIGFVVFEAATSSGLNEGHCDIAIAIADVLSQAFARERVHVSSGLTERLDEREDLLFQIANGICDSLQISQGMLDVAMRSILTDFHDKNSLGYLKLHIDHARAGLEESVSIVNQIYRAEMERVVEIGTVDITQAVKMGLQRSNLTSDCFDFCFPATPLYVSADFNELVDGFSSLFRQSNDTVLNCSGCKDCKKVLITLWEVGSAVVLRVVDLGEPVGLDQLPWAFHRTRRSSTISGLLPRTNKGLWRLHQHIQAIGGNSTAFLNLEKRMTFEFVLLREFEQKKPQFEVQVG